MNDDVLCSRGKENRNQLRKPEQSYPIQKINYE